MHGVGIAEQVVQIPQNLLIGADQEEADVVILVLLDLVQRQELGPAVLAHKTGDLSIGVTGDIGNRGHHIRPLVEPLQRHDREQLVNGPGVRDGLEQREVGKIGLT